MSGLKGFDSWVSYDRDYEESYKHDLAMERAIEDILMDDDEVFCVIQHYVESLATIDLPAIAADDGAMALAELARDLAPEDKKATYQAKVERYEKEKNEIKVVADKLEAEAKQWDEQSDEQMHLHHRWAQSTTALQVAIALAAIALLTKKRWLQYGMFGVAGVGVAIGAAAMMHI